MIKENKDPNERYCIRCCITEKEFKRDGGGCVCGHYRHRYVTDKELEEK